MSTKTRGKIARSEKSRDFPRGTSSICRKIVHCRRLNRARRVLEHCRQENLKDEDKNGKQKGSIQRGSVYKPAKIWTRRAFYGGEIKLD
jgi:hypothetical protein